MLTSDFDYELPPELIAQEPSAIRDECRLLAMDRTTGELQDLIFRDIEGLLRPGDLLVANETRVRPARCPAVPSDAARCTRRESACGALPRSGRTPRCGRRPRRPRASS